MILKSAGLMSRELTHAINRCQIYLLTLDSHFVDIIHVRF